jgi:plastocyanin
VPRTLAAVACGLVLTAGLTGCALGRHAAALPKDAAIIDISHMAYDPNVVEVRVGQPVVWKFEDPGVVHDIVGLTGPVPGSAKFHSPDQENGDWIHTFTAAGTYTYYCSLHTYMRGKVIVVAPGTSGS